MRQILILFVLVSCMLACKKGKDESNNSSTLKMNLLSPADGATVQAGNEVEFKWSSSSSNSSVPLTHKIIIAEIIGDQLPAQALHTSKPIFEKDSCCFLQKLNVTSSAGSPKFTIGKKYAWEVTASQKGLTSTGGTSGVSMFTVIR